MTTGWVLFWRAAWGSLTSRPRRCLRVSANGSLNIPRDGRWVVDPAQVTPSEAGAVALALGGRTSSGDVRALYLGPVEVRPQLRFW